MVPCGHSYAVCVRVTSRSPPSWKFVSQGHVFQLKNFLEVQNEVVRKARLARFVGGGEKQKELELRDHWLWLVEPSGTKNFLGRVNEDGKVSESWQEKLSLMAS